MGFDFVFTAGQGSRLRDRELAGGPRRHGRPRLSRHPGDGGSVATRRPAPTQGRRDLRRKMRVALAALLPYIEQDSLTKIGCATRLMGDGSVRKSLSEGAKTRRHGHHRTAGPRPDERARHGARRHRLALRHAIDRGVRRIGDRRQRRVVAADPDAGDLGPSGRVAVRCRQRGRRVCCPPSSSRRSSGNRATCCSISRTFW